MCRVLYLVSADPLPESGYDSERFPNVCVQAMDPEYAGALCERVLPLFPGARHVHYLGAGDACGCYFFLSETLPEDPLFRDHQAGIERAIRTLADYLDDLPTAGDVWLYLPVEGEEGEPPVARETLTPAFLRTARVFAPRTNAAYRIVR